MAPSFAPLRPFSPPLLPDARGPLSGRLLAALRTGAALGDVPALGGEVVFGARALGRVEARLTAHLRSAWAGDRSSLLGQAEVRHAAA